MTESDFNVGDEFWYVYFPNNSHPLGINVNERPSYFKSQNEINSHARNAFRTREEALAICNNIRKLFRLPPKS